MTTGLPRLSFVIPVRDDARRLASCISSIRRTDYPPELVDIVVIDHGSIDASAAVARAAGATVLAIPNGRVAELRNQGALAARGDILAFVDADHEISAGWIHAAVDALSMDNTVAVGSPYRPPSNGSWVEQRYDLLRDHRPGRYDVTWLGSGNLAVRRHAFEAVGGFDTSLQTCEDVDLCQRLARHGRIAADSNMQSTHFGDPTTLAAIFRGELWRGRDNLRVTLRGAATFKNYRSALIPLLTLVGMAIIPASLVVGWPVVAAFAVMVVLSLSLVRTLAMLRRSAAITPISIGQTLLVALAYDLGRAASLIAPGNHSVRRISGKESDGVPARSHS